MKIKKISCDQFAGIRDIDITFDDGVNVVYGKNESGKSTLVNLLSRTLFQKAAIDLRSDKQFTELYFPSVPKGGREIKGVDGKVKFEKDNKSYTLSKVWGEGESCSLSMPEGIVRDQDRINEILHEILGYGEGVYSEMLFSSQRNTDNCLQTVLDASKNTDAKNELAAAVTRAFAQSDGLSVDAIEQQIIKKIKEIAGGHWDEAKEAPVKKSGGGRWTNNTGEILKTYYMLEDAVNVLKRIDELEKRADLAIADYEEKNAQAEAAENACREFDKYANQLIKQSSLKDKLARLKSDLLRYAEILDNWPVLEGQLQKAGALQTEKQHRELLDKYSAAKLIFDGLTKLKTDQQKLICPSASEISAVKSAQREVASLENKLCGMNLAATVKMLGGNSVEIKSLRTGEAIEVTGENVTISEAVKVTVPGVIEMQLAPANVDVASVETQIRDKKSYMYAIFAKYGVDGADTLEALEKRFSENEMNIKSAEVKLDAALGDIAFDELENAAKLIPADVRGREDILADVFALCQRTEISAFIAAKRAVLEGYVKEYGNITSLTETQRRAQDECAAIEAEINGTAVPAEYLNVQDPEGYKRNLQVASGLKKKAKEEAIDKKASATAVRDDYISGLMGDPEEDVERAKKDFDEQKALLARWRHIYEVFLQHKNSLSGNPMQDIADSFTKYLGIISGGNISSEFPQPNRLDVNIYSASRPVNYDKLSEGTKETVSLAFRLALLDHLFPEGGGVIVLDDPLTDMDAERTNQACKLIAECAKRHQVILLTCKKEYAAMLGGKTINIG